MQAQNKSSCRGRQSPVLHHSLHQSLSGGNACEGYGQKMPYRLAPSGRPSEGTNLAANLPNCAFAKAFSVYLSTSWSWRAKRLGSIMSWREECLRTRATAISEGPPAAIISTRVFSDFCPSKVVTKVSSMRSEPSLQCLFSVLTMDILFFFSSQSLSPLMVILTAKVIYSSFEKHALVGVPISAAAI